MSSATRQSSESFCTSGSHEYCPHDWAEGGGRGNLQGGRHFTCCTCGALVVGAGPKDHPANDLVAKVALKDLECELVIVSVLADKDSEGRKCLVFPCRAPDDVVEQLSKLIEHHRGVVELPDGKGQQRECTRVLAVENGVCGSNCSIVVGDVIDSKGGDNES